jgi:putative transposase
MAYVDLNPIRADIAATPEESEFTSIYVRIQAMNSPSEEGGRDATQCTARHLMPFRDSASAETTSLPMMLTDYLQLVAYFCETLGLHEPSDNCAA